MLMVVLISISGLHHRKEKKVIGYKQMPVKVGFH
jgi:hypothetical protein